MKNKLAAIFAALMLFFTLSVPEVADLEDPVTEFPGTAENEDSQTVFITGGETIELGLVPIDKGNNN